LEIVNHQWSIFNEKDFCLPAFFAQSVSFFTENKKRRAPSFLDEKTRFEKPVHGVSPIRYCFIRQFLYNKLIVMATS